MLRFRKNPVETMDMPTTFDASRYMLEMKREALTTLVPHPDEKEARIDLITLLRGKRPNLYQLYRARVQEAGLLALARGEDPDIEGLDLVSFVRDHAPSLDGFRSKQVVEIAKTEHSLQSSSFLESLRRRRQE